jgi:putative hemolysin
MPEEQITLIRLIYLNLPSMLAIAALIGVSGLVAGSETAIFSLSHYDRLRMKMLFPRLSGVIDNLSGKPEQILIVINVLNMAVNSLIFTLSSLMVYRFARADYHVVATLIGILTLFGLVFFGEILLKAWIYYLRIPVSAIVAGPLWFFLRIGYPILKLTEQYLVVPLTRLIIGGKPEPNISKEELIALFNVSGEEKYLQPSQVDLLVKVTELTELRVKDIMVPRVKMVSCDIHEPVEVVKQLVRESNRSSVAIYVYQIDYIVGIIRSRRLFVEHPESIKNILERVKFVPEFQRVDQLLRFFHTEDVDVAMVVDEYGGLQGMVSMEDLMEKTIGEMTSEFPEPDAPRIVQISKDDYIADGHLPVEDFFEKFSITLSDDKADTLAGLVMNHIGHLPEIGERIEFEGLKLIVRHVDYNRLRKILIQDRRQ